MNDTWYYLAHEATRRAEELHREAAAARAARRPGAAGLRGALADSLVSLAARLDARYRSLASGAPQARFA